MFGTVWCGQVEVEKYGHHFFASFNNFGNMESERTTPEARLRLCGISTDDVEESFARSSGPGGQNVNKVETLVRLVHRPSGMTVVASEHRSRAMNRRAAWVRLAEKFEALREALRLERAAKRSRKRAQAARRSPGTKRRMVESKRRRGETKKFRERVRES